MAAAELGRRQRHEPQRVVCGEHDGAAARVLGCGDCRVELSHNHLVEGARISMCQSSVGASSMSRRPREGDRALRRREVHDAVLKVAGKFVPRVMAAKPSAVAAELRVVLRLVGVGSARQAVRRDAQIDAVEAFQEGRRVGEPDRVDIGDEDGTLQLEEREEGSDLHSPHATEALPGRSRYRGSRTCRQNWSDRAQARAAFATPAASAGRAPPRSPACAARPTAWAYQFCAKWR